MDEYRKITSKYIFDVVLSMYFLDKLSKTNNQLS